jgi:hypothetical protein
MIYNESENNPAHDAKEECGRIFTAPERKKQCAFEHFGMYKTSCHINTGRMRKNYRIDFANKTRNRGENKDENRNMDRETNQE